MKKTILSMALFISGILMQCMLISSANSTPDLTSYWLTGFDGTISTDGQASTYPYQVGIIEDNVELGIPSDAPQFRLVETKNSVVEKEEATDTWLNRLPRATIDDSVYPEFTGGGTVRKVLGNLYGQWYTRHPPNCDVVFCFHILFVPNATKINTLQIGDVVKSTLTFRIPISSGDVQTSLAVTISVPPPITLSIAPRDYYSNESVPSNPNLIRGYFTITSDRAPPSDLPYRWTANDESSISSHPNQKISADQTTSELRLSSRSTNPDRVTVSLAPSADGSYIVGSPSTATVYKVSATKPGISISFVEADGTAIPEGGSIDQGEGFKIKATATPAPDANLTVSINLASNPLGVLASGSSPSTSITIDTTGTGMSGLLSTETDGTVNGGAVTVTVPTSTSYVTARSTASLTVDPAPPVTLSIAPRENYSDELSILTPLVLGYFTVTADPAPTIDVRFRWTISDRDGISVNPNDKILAGQTTAEVRGSTWFTNPDSMTITLAPSADGKYVVGTPNSATVYAVSATKPGISISFVEADGTAIPEGGSIDQGEGFKIKATATPAPDANLTVSISLASDPLGVLASGSSPSTSITLDTTGTGLSEVLSTETDGTVNGGTVTATVPTSSSYVINTGSNPLTARLTVDALPITLSIEPKMPYSTDQDAVFTVTAFPTPAIDVPFEYTLLPWDIFGSGNDIKVSAGQTTYDLTVRRAGPSANVGVMLEGVDGRYVVGTPSTATVYYTTAGQPGISISFVETDGTDIAEGGSIYQRRGFKIKATATPAPTAEISVGISFTQTPSGVLAAGSRLPTSITINAGDTEGLSDVISTATSGTVNGGTVEVTLQTSPSNEYVIARSTASLTVDPVVTLSIAPREYYVEEYYATPGRIIANFTVTANPAPVSDIQYRWTQSGQNGIFSDPTDKIRAGGTTSTFLTFSTSENPDSATVTLADSADGSYVVGTPNTATVYKVSYANPGISISFVEADGTDIAEGGSIDMGDQFKIKASAFPAPTAADLTVNITIDQSPTGIIDAGSSIPATFTINRFDTESVSGVLSTETDGTVNGGTVTVSLATSSSYKIHPAHSSASLTVDPAPSVTLSIAPKTPYISTGNAEFIVTTDSASKINLPFRYYLTDETQLVSASVPVGQTTYEFTPTGASSSADVTVNLEESADNRYVLGTQMAATVNYTTTSRPGISISFVEADGTDIAEGGSINRGEQFKIKATATPAPNDNLIVSISIAQTPLDVIQQEQDASLPDSITIDTTGTGLSEGVMTSRGATGTTITVTVTSSASYATNPTRGTASLTVNASTVILTIAPKMPFYSRDGVDVTFIVTADPAPAMDLPIRYHMYDNVMAQPANENIKVSAGETTYELTIRAMQNVDYTKVRLARSDGYMLGNPNIAKVFHPESGEPGITISFVKVDGRNDIDLAEGVGINRGNRFKVKATATPAPSSLLTVSINIRPSNTDTIASNSSIPSSIPIAANATEGKSGEIRTATAETADGNITVTLLPGGNNYKVHSAFNTATLTVSGASSSSSSSGSDGPQGASEEYQRRRSMASTVRAIQPTVVAGSAESTEDALESQFNLAFSGGGSSFTLGGNSSLTEALTFSGEVANGRTVSLEDFISGSSFKLQLFPEEGGTGMASIWGVGDSLEVSGTGSDSNLSWDGSMLAGHLGFDVRLDRELVFGLASSFSEAETEFANDNDVYGNGTYHSRSVSMHPYIGWKSPDGNAEVRSSIGYGTGELTVTQKGYAPEKASTSLAMLSVAGSRTLYSADGTASGGRSELRVKGDTWATHQFVHDNNRLIDNMQFAVSHSLLAAEASHMWELSSGSTLYPGLLLGIERDGRDGRTELGAVAGGRISYGNPLGFTASGSMISPLSGDVRDFGLRGLLDYDFASDGLGPVLKVSSAWGDSKAGDELFTKDVVILNVDTAQSKHNSGSKHGVEIGYGLAFFDDAATLVPFSGVELADGKIDEFGFGSRMAVGTDIGVELNWTRTVRTDEAGSILNLSADAKW